MRKVEITSSANLAIVVKFADLAVVVDVEILKNGFGNLFVLVLYLLGGSVNLFLPFLFAALKSAHEVDGGAWPSK